MEISQISEKQSLQQRISGWQQYLWYTAAINMNAKHHPECLFLACNYKHAYDFLWHGVSLYIINVPASAYVSWQSEPNIIMYLLHSSSWEIIRPGCDWLCHSTSTITILTHNTQLPQLPLTLLVSLCFDYASSSPLHSWAYLVWISTLFLSFQGLSIPVVNIVPLISCLN